MERGERIAIVAGGHMPPNDVIQLGWEWTVGVSTVGPARHVDAPGGMDCDCDDPDEGAWSVECSALNEWVPALLHDEGAHGWSVHAPLPLGAVVCTVTVDDALPILDEAASDEGDSDCLAVYTDPHGGLVEWRIDPDEIGESDFPHDGQLPLGDFTPGRWGWMLSDPQPITKRCVECDGTGGYWGPCSCRGSGRVPADPIPCKGRQGVFELPAEIAEQLS